MRRLVAFFALGGLLLPAVSGADSSTVVSYARTADLSGAKATLFKHESILLGLSCRSGPVGELINLQRVSLGDTIRYGEYSFVVGIIEVTLFKKDVSWSGEVLGRKGEVNCVLAADKQSLPSDDDCDALWVLARGCRTRK
jgi:hypothetical protein